jgi:transcription antitermination factor NusG
LSADLSGPVPGQDPARQWFAVRTRSRAEKAVRDYLSQKMVEVFLPTVTRWSRWKDRKKAIEWPLFPGYCFVRIALIDELTILKCPQVADIVTLGGSRVPIPEAEILALQQLVSSDMKYDAVPFIKEGMKVEVVHGPLRGVVGRLVRKGAHARLILAVDIIAQAVSVEVDAADVKPY